MSDVDVSGRFNTAECHSCRTKYFLRTHNVPDTTRPHYLTCPNVFFVEGAKLVSYSVCGVYHGDNARSTG